jgi:restriction system protein
MILLILVLAAIVVGTRLTYFWLQNRKFRALQIENIDSMTGVEFEQYLQKLLGRQGYSVSITRATGDLGIDLIACRARDRIAIQVKRHNAKVSRRAVSDAVAGMQHYRCDRAMVITNSHFTPGAIMLARSTNCTLVNRDLLAQWILQFKGTSSLSSFAVRAAGIFLCCLLIFVLFTVSNILQKREVKQQISYSTPTPESSEPAASWTTPPYATPAPALVPMLFDTTTGLYSPITDHRSKNQIEVWENPDLIKDGKYIGENPESTSRQ